ncbi:dihydrodipicolinate synthase [Fusarium fujikuroi]|nr:dihydrodipicolinate synthase [Fusarium fujikuroi]
MGSPKASQLRLGDGVYVPTLAFFTPEDEVDASATEKHIIKLLESGVAGIVVHGSNGECAHLSPSERTTIIRVARDTIFHEGSGSRVPLIAGCGAQSTRETTELCEDAGKAGATHALVLPPSYYGGLLPDDLVIQHYYAVADKSPIPLLVYNFPGAAAGRDLSSDTILSIAKHPNVVGVKLTCGNTGKLARRRSQRHHLRPRQPLPQGMRPHHRARRGRKLERSPSAASQSGQGRLDGDQDWVRWCKGSAGTLFRVRGRTSTTLRGAISEGS